VVVCEGEECANAFSRIGVPATANAGGAGKWTSKLSQYFTGADVILVPDADDVGFRHIEEVATSLSGIARRLRVLVLPDLPPKGDVIDWLAAGGTREAFDRLVDDAPDWQPVAQATEQADEKAKAEAEAEAKAKAEADEQELIDGLARLSRTDYERRRRPAARELGIRSNALDAEVEARRPQQREQTGPVPLFGHWVVEPWPEPVDLAELLDDIVKQIKRYNVLPDHFADTVALWDL
jgi:DNA primase